MDARKTERHIWVGGWVGGLCTYPVALDGACPHVAGDVGELLGQRNELEAEGEALYCWVDGWVGGWVGWRRR